MGIPTGLSFGQASTNPQSIYQNMLSFAQQNYQNITSGYENVLANQRSAEAAVQAGYGNLQGNVQAMIGNVGAGQNLQNQQTYASAQANTQNQMINAGLGNTTIMGQEQLKNTGNYAIAQNQLADQIAQLQAGYYSQIGLAGLNYQGQSVNADTALQAHQLDYMANQSYPYMEGLGHMGGSGFGGGGGGGMSIGPMGGGVGGVQGMSARAGHIGNIPGGGYGGGGGGSNLYWSGQTDSGAWGYSSPGGSGMYNPYGQGSGGISQAQADRLAGNYAVGAVGGASYVGGVPGGSSFGNVGDVGGGDWGTGE